MHLGYWYYSFGQTCPSTGNKFTAVYNMNKKERVLTALKGGIPDHVPVCFSLHFPKERAFGKKGVESHLEFFQKTDTDILKIMNENLVPYMGEIKYADDWNKIKRISLADDFMQNQIRMVDSILENCEDNAFIVGTLHGTVASAIHPIEDIYGYETVREMFCAHLRENPTPLSDAFKRLSEGMVLLAEKYISMGVDGIYYAGLGGEKYYFTDAEFAEYIAPRDMSVLFAVKEAGGFTFLHMCKDKLNLERYRNYTFISDVVNWGVYEDNISLEEGRKIFTDSTIMGGLQNRSGVMVYGSDSELSDEVKKIIKKEGRRNFILGADCTLATETDYSRIRLISDTAHTI